MKSRMVGHDGFAPARGFRTAGANGAEVLPAGTVLTWHKPTNRRLLVPRRTKFSAIVDDPELTVVVRSSSRAARRRRWRTFKEPNLKGRPHHTKGALPSHRGSNAP
jgi:hypothetical protein